MRTILLPVYAVILWSSVSLANPIDLRDFRGRSEIESLLLKEAKETGIKPRLEHLSAAFLGRPFVDGNLGEGINGDYDNDPLCRTDVFDCTTYVETVLAMALSQDWESFKKNILRIRYAGGEVGFLTRNHFVEVDWIANNSQREKILTDVTGDLFPRESLSARTDVKKARWYDKMTVDRLVRPDLAPTDLELALERLKKETAGIEDAPATLLYLPYRSIIQMSQEEFEKRQAQEAAIREAHKGKPTLKEALARYRTDFLKSWEADGKINHQLLKRIPSMVIVNYTHPERPLEKLIGTNMLVSHQGFLLWKDGVLYARHASLNDKVIDINFLEYANQFIIPGKLNLEPQGINILNVLAP